ncbi:MAG: hypothetical protein A2Y02_02030 [Omnitrophica bacterium GWA2_52_12]|nr:MAG: hypothetical protein A2Y02_02030 [Omnitrophica bacterium GWA2_52_12]
MKKTTRIFTALLLWGILPQAGVADEIQGVATGWWSDAAGNNYYGDAPSASSSSSYDSGDSGYAYSAAYGDAAGKLGEAVGAAFSQALSNMAAAQAAYSQAYSLNFQGNRAMSQRDYPQAVAFYQQALGYLPNDALIARNLGKAQAGLHNARGLELHKQGDWQNAIAAYKEALQYDPSNRAIRQNIRLAQQRESYEKIRFREEELRRQMQQTAVEMRMRAEALTVDLKPAPDPKDAALQNLSESKYGPNKGLHINENVPLPDPDARLPETPEVPLAERMQGSFKIVGKAADAIIETYHESTAWVRKTASDMGWEQAWENAPKYIPGAGIVKQVKEYYKDTGDLFEKAGDPQIETADQIFGQLGSSVQRAADPDQRLTSGEMDEILAERAEFHRREAHYAWREKYLEKSKETMKEFVKERKELAKERAELMAEREKEHHEKWRWVKDPPPKDKQLFFDFNKEPAPKKK